MHAIVKRADGYDSIQTHAVSHTTRGWRNNYARATLVVYANAFAYGKTTCI